MPSFGSYVGLAQLAIANGATAPVPAEGAGALAWSTTLLAPVIWNGSSWATIGGGSAIPSIVPTGTTYDIPANAQQVMVGPLTLNGTLTLEGQLLIL